ASHPLFCATLLLGEAEVGTRAASLFSRQARIAAFTEYLSRVGSRHPSRPSTRRCTRLTVGQNSCLAASILSTLLPATSIRQLTRGSFSDLSMAKRTSSS